MNLGQMVDKLNATREKKRSIQKQLDEAEAAYNALAEEIIAKMDSEGVEKTTGKTASVSKSVSIKPNVLDWDAFYAYIHRNKYYHILERRPSVTGCRELFETKGKVPGVEAFTKVTLNLRNLS